MGAPTWTTASLSCAAPKHAAGDRRPDRPADPARAACASARLRQRRLRVGNLMTRRVRVELRDLQLLGLELDLLLRVLEALLDVNPCCASVVARPRSEAAACASATVARSTAACARSSSASATPTRSSSPRSVRTSRKAGALGTALGHQCAILHFVAHLELDAQQAPVDRRRHDVALAHARLAVVHDLHERTAHDGRHVHLDGCGRNAHQRAGAHAASSSHNPRVIQSRFVVIRVSSGTATRSSVSMRRPHDQRAHAARGDDRDRRERVGVRLDDDRNRDHVAVAHPDHHPRKRVSGQATQRTAAISSSASSPSRNVETSPRVKPSTRRLASSHARSCSAIRALL